MQLSSPLPLVFLFFFLQSDPGHFQHCCSCSSRGGEPSLSSSPSAPGNWCAGPSCLISAAVPGPRTPSSAKNTCRVTRVERSPGPSDAPAWSLSLPCYPLSLGGLNTSRCLRSCSSTSPFQSSMSVFSLCHPVSSVLKLPSLPPTCLHQVLPRNPPATTSSPGPWVFFFKILFIYS